MSQDITITLTDADWIRLAVVIKVMRDEATTVPGAQILGDLALRILDQVQPQLTRMASAAASLAASSGEDR